MHHLQTVGADVFDPTSTDGASVSVRQEQRSRHVRGSLRRCRPVRRRLPFRVHESDALEPEESDRGVWPADHAHDLSEPRGDHLRGRHVFTPRRQVVQPAQGPVEVPLPRRVQGLENVFHPVGRGLGVVELN